MFPGSPIGLVNYDIMVVTILKITERDEQLLPKLQG